MFQRQFARSLFLAFLGLDVRPELPQLSENIGKRELMPDCYFQVLKVLDLYMKEFGRTNKRHISTGEVSNTCLTYRHTCI